MFYSSRNHKNLLKASEAILQGLSIDGGLFLPEKIVLCRVDEELINLSYQELAFRLLRPYLDDFSDEEVRLAITSAYDENHFEEKIMDVTTFGNHSIMELFHGQTLTFKDMALSLLPYLMQTAKNKHPQTKKIKILTATSGDTGSAVLSSFSKVKDIDVSILYPDDGISAIQEKQMLYFTSFNARAYALKESNFDDCQSFVKKMLVKHENEGYTSANSINIGRLLPQVVYYYFTYITLVKRQVIKAGEKIDFVVPTGNFGDIFAGYLAKKMGLPIQKLIVASNENRILTDFFTTGVYDLRREFYKTNSPSMDILISSNLERLLSDLYQDEKEVSRLMKESQENKVFAIDKDKLAKLQETFSAYTCNEEETLETIASLYQERHYLLDPHSAVAYHCYKQYKSDRHVVIISTASPLKFPNTIAKALKMKIKDDVKLVYDILNSTGLTLPRALKKVLSCQVEKELIDKKDVEQEIFFPHTYIVNVPATSANVGPGFDILGIALSLYNTYQCSLSTKNEIIGFGHFNHENNLVMKSYRYAFEKLNLEPLPIRLEQIHERVPSARGLGSSSCCIIAGLTIANEILHHYFTKHQLLLMASELEGHPDNVAPCLFGGMIGNVKIDGEYQSYPLEVNDDLLFVAICPGHRVKTALARSVLPATYKRDDVVENLSHILFLPKAFKDGDTKLLRHLLQDKIHVPYRKNLIKDFDIFNQIANTQNLPFTISGSGSTMIYIIKPEQRTSLEKALQELQPEHAFNYYVLKKDSHGVKVERNLFNV